MTGLSDRSLGKRITASWVLQRLATLLSVVALTLVLLAAVTGVLLAFYYEPSAGEAFNSLRWITEFVPGGNLIRSLHDIAGNGIIGIAILQIFVMFLGRRQQVSWFAAWISGWLLVIAAIGLGWTAVILDWDQVGYWRFKIEVGTFGSLPLVGGLIRTLLLGGDSISSVTVAHLYTFHSYLLSIGAVVLAIVHLGTLLYQERFSHRETLTAAGLEAASQIEPIAGQSLADQSLTTESYPVP
ncbi:MAG: cytochrome b N-terminal domain-containing protein [Elainella sp. Prado103]|nr:cytochrome b N-terminal domain-containing protein [Elainella sp. Prado103]